MTSLLVWFAADGKKGANFKPASVYIASDSRVTWGNAYNWDHGKKVFACSKHPDIFGYCGDSLFAALVLGQIVGAIDSGFLFTEKDTASEKIEKVAELIRMSWEDYPDKEKRAVNIIHCTRDQEAANSKFLARVHAFDEMDKQWSNTSNIEVPTGEISRPIIVHGSGKSYVESNIEEWNRKYSDRHTSRAIFAAFCQSLKEAGDKNSGGAPQLVGLYRIGMGRSFGVIWNGKRYFEGLRSRSGVFLDGVSWRNDSFEIVNPKTRRRKPNAAIHKRNELSNQDPGGFNQIGNRHQNKT